MTPERLAQIRAIYETAIDKGTGERDELLLLHCQGDEALRQDVEALLRAHDRVPQWLDQPVLGATVTSPSQTGPIPSMEGRQFGSYKLIREIGRGGMGLVYLAERADGAFHKQVAIKFVHPGSNNAEVIERFQREREILAALDHPNIARILDAGATAEGLPYFVMEYVEGLPIHRWCEERKLNITERIALFRTVCGAVEYAHQHLVVHRDLKPGNILVTLDGSVKLLDFGIGKLLHPPESGEFGATSDLDRAMTPEYASPEQVKGGPITTLTDVYSLGVVLYELLTGHMPYRLKRAALLEMVRVISEEEPARPSEVVTSRDHRVAEDDAAVVSPLPEGDVQSLQKRLAGDIDCILLNALRKEPDRRYRSIAAFSEDLERHLENWPVKARDDSFWYRAERYIRRHPSNVLAGALIGISALTGMLTAVWQTRMLLAFNIPAEAALAPLTALFASFVLTAFGCAIYFTRATLRRTAGALGGSLILAPGALLKYWIDYSAGWWHFTPQGKIDHLVPALFPIAVFAGGMLLLIIWRVLRRFGKKIRIPLILLLGFGSAARERIWMTQFLPVVNIESGVGAILGDSALWMVIWTLGLLMMGAIAGGPRGDVLHSR